MVGRDSFFFFFYRVLFVCFRFIAAFTTVGRSEHELSLVAFPLYLDPCTFIMPGAFE